MVRTPGLLQQVPPETIRLELDRRIYLDRRRLDWWPTRSVLRDYDFFYGLEGAALFEVGGRSLRIGRGQALLLPPGVPISARSSGREFLAFAQHFRLSVYENIDLFTLIRTRPVARLDLTPALVARWRRLAEQGPRRADALELHAVFFEILQRFIRRAYLGDVAGHPERVTPLFAMLRILHAGLYEERPLKEALGELPYSYQYLVRVFKRHLGCAPKAYIIRKRLEKARELLARGVSVREAAEGSGFGDPLYFSRLFRQIEGCAPSVWARRSAGGPLHRLAAVGSGISSNSGSR